MLFSQFGSARSAAIATYNGRLARSAGLPFSSTYMCMNPSMGALPAAQQQSGVSNIVHAHCMVCGSRNTCPRVRMLLPEVGMRCMHRINFCRRHAPPDHMLRTVTSFDDLKQVVAMHMASAAASSSAR